MFILFLLHQCMMFIMVLTVSGISSHRLVSGRPLWRIVAGKMGRVRGGERERLRSDCFARLALLLFLRRME